MLSAARTFSCFVASLVLLVTILVTAPPLSATPAPANPADPPGHDPDVIAHWTPERMAKAQPRDLVIDHRGLGYLKAADGSLRPYNHNRPYRLQQVTTGARIMAKPPSGGGDTDGPEITLLSPKNGAEEQEGVAVSFRATVTDDPSGVRSVDIVIKYPDGRTQSFAAGSQGGDVYGTDLSGFTVGDWQWYVVATDNARRGGNTTTSEDLFALTIKPSGGGDPGGDPGGDIVTNSRWTAGGDIQLSAGRILFEMPAMRGKRITGWNTYVCSGTTVADTNTGASVILTAAHCVYDDVAKKFAHNVLFIPGQDDGGNDGTDRDCSNDPLKECFFPSHGVVNVNWTTDTFPDNVKWDYAYYVVPGESLEGKVNEQSIQFTPLAADDMTRAMGYSYNDDPYFMYCAEPMEVKTPDVNWWLPNCGLTGGSSGGPWIQPTDETTTGSGPIISVNSWGYTNQPGMAGPVLDDSAWCVFAQANNEDVLNSEQVTVEDRGVVVTVVPPCEQGAGN